MARADWKELPLDQLYDFRSGLSKPRSAFGSGDSFLSFKDVFYNYFVPDNLSELVNSTAREQESCSVRIGDVFLTRTSETMDELGMSCVALKDYEKATFNGFTKRLRPKSSTEVFPEYAGYYFRSPRFRSEVTAMSSLSTRASLNNDMLSRLVMVLPSYDEQIAIGSILKRLDDKIELNRRMNETLEAAARALFKSWFVDFDPVLYKLAGKDPCAPVADGGLGIDPQTAALFPDKLIPSALGMIPEGWEVIHINDCGEVICGKTPPTKDDDNYGIDVPFITIPDMHGKVFAFTTKKNLSQQGANTQPKKFLPPLSVCVSCIATTGLVVLTDKSSQTNQQINSIIPKQNFSPYYIYGAMEMLGDSIGRSGTGGSVFANLSKSRFSAMEILHPSNDVMACFSVQVKAFYSLLLANEYESQTLASIRDALLPKLISGEIEIGETHV